MGNIFSLSGCFSGCFSNKTIVTSIFGKRKRKLRKTSSNNILVPLYYDYPIPVEPLITATGTTISLNQQLTNYNLSPLSIEYNVMESSIQQIPQINSTFSTC